MSGRRTKAVEEPAPRGGPEDAPPRAFEAGLARLEEIVQQLEDGELPLESSLALFEEGTRIARSLGATLADAERRVEVLLGEGPDGPRTAPFTPDDED